MPIPMEVDMAFDPNTRKWLEESGIKKENMPEMVAFEYFEVKRLLNHQLKADEIMEK